MTARRSRAGWPRSMIGSNFVPVRTRNATAIDDQPGIVGFYSLSSFTLAITDLTPREANSSHDNDARQHKGHQSALVASMASGHAAFLAIRIRCLSLPLALH
jgi:hypothetical protein